MSRLLASVSLRVKLYVLALVPLLAMVAFAGMMVLERQSAAGDSQDSKQYVNDSVVLGEFLHQLQLERGITAVFVGAKGKEMASELQQQRRATDGARARFEKVAASTLPPAVMTKLTAFNEALRGLGNARSQADGLTTPAPQISAYYTATNETLLGVRDALAAAVKDAEITRLVDAYTFLSKAKEQVGVERAELASAFSADRFAGTQLSDTISALAKQDAYLTAFKNRATPAVVALYTQLMNDPAVAQVDKMQSLALKRAATGGFSVESTEWYNAVTAKINLLKKVEDAQATELLDRAGQTHAAAQRAMWISLAVATLLAVLTMLLTWAIIRGVLAVVAAVSSVATALKAGDLTSRTGMTGNDELGRMAAALDEATGSLRNTMRSAGESAQAVAAASEQLTAASTQIAAAAEETSAQATVVAAAAEQVSRNVQTVSAGSEEMSTSILEISNNATEAAKVAASATRLADQTNQGMSKLGEASAQIGNVVALITSIAEQTNLLALNATIEAARAGDAGKGFAVVASEVKDLAQETARATDDISGRVAAIQSEIQIAVTSIGQIGDVIGTINDYASTIASAVEEQTATTSEIGRSVHEAATGSTSIAENITGVATAAGTTTQGGVECQGAANNLAELASKLNTLVNQFTY